MGCAYQDGNKTWCDEFWKATTDPGISYLGEKEMLNEKGTAILVPGQYKNVYKIDKHKGKYTRFAKEEKLKFGEIIIKTIYLIGKVKQTPVIILVLTYTVQIQIQKT